MVMMMSFNKRTFLFWNFLAVVVAATATAVSSAVQLESEKLTTPSKYQAPLLESHQKGKDRHLLSEISRFLVIGDFESVNQVFDTFTIEIPDVTIEDRFLGVDLTLNLYNIRCDDIHIGDATLTSNPISATSVSFLLDVIQLDITCELDYDYKYGIFSGSTSVVALTDDNSLLANILVSQQSTVDAPTDFEIPICSADIKVTDLDFSGGIVAGILDILDRVIRNFIQDQVNRYLCNFLVDADETTVDLLQTIAHTLDPYLNQTLNEPLDPLAAEIQISSNNSDANQTFINLLNPDSKIGVGVVTLLQEASRILGGARGEGGVDLGINIIIREFILDQNGQFELALIESNILDGGVILNSTGNTTETLIQIQGIRLKGLDSFVKFSPFMAIGQFTMQANFSWQALYLELDLLVEFGPSGTNESVRETVTLIVEMDDIDVEASFLLVIKRKELAELQVGSLFNTSAILDCFASTISSLNFTSLTANVGLIKEPVFLGFQSPGLDRLLTELVDGVFHLYDEILLKTVPSIFQKTLRTLLNSQLADFTFDAECPAPLSFSTTDLIDFRDLFYTSDMSARLGASGTSPYGNLGVVIMNLIERELLVIDEKTGLPEINSNVIAPLTTLQSGTKGTLSVERNILDVNGNLDFGNLDAAIYFGASNASLGNLDTVQHPLVLIRPDNTAPHELDNNATIGLPERPLRVAVRLFLALDGNGVNIRDEFDVSLDLTVVNIVLDILMKTYTNRVMSLPVEDLVNLDCWLATIPTIELDKSGVRVPDEERTAGITQLSAALSNFRLGINCVDCTSPGLEDLSRLLKTPEAIADLEETAKQLLDYTLRFMNGEFLQIIVDRELAEASKRCPHSPEYDPNYESPQFDLFEVKEGSSSGLSLVFILAGTTIGLILILVLLGVFVRCFVRRRHSIWIKTLSHENVARVLNQQRRDARVETMLQESTLSMFRSEEVPVFVRYFIPLVLVLNIALFVSGHVDIGGALGVYVRFAGEELRVDSVMEFSIVSSAVQLWEAGGTTLAIFILIFSGVWPYTKQLITLVVWFLPPTILSVSRRGSIFIWLDSLAKWSTVDIFFLIISVVAFQINLKSPEYSFLPEDFYEVNAMLAIKWGLYANMIAQLLSQISSHVIIHYHRKVVENGRRRAAEFIKTMASDDDNRERALDTSIEDDRDQEEIRKDILHEHLFMRPHRGEATGLKIRPWVNPCLCIVTAFLVVLAIVGSFLPSFQFEQLGVVAVAIEIGRNFEEAIDEYSVFTVASALVDQARFLDTVSDYVGLVSIAVLFIVTVFIVPLLLLVLLLFQWFAPLTRKRRNRLEVAIETLHSWQYLDVFLVALVVSSWQLGSTSEVLVNSYCEGLEAAFNAFEFYGILSANDAQCFQLNPGIEIGCYLLIASAFLLALLNIFVARAVEQYQRDGWRDDVEGTDSYTIRLMSQISLSEGLRKIKTTPELFSDNFRWVLQSRNTSVDQTETHHMEDAAEMQHTKVQVNVVAVENSESYHDDDAEQSSSAVEEVSVQSVA